MNKGAFEEASKILTLGKDTCEKNGEISGEYNCILVNLITCYRDLGKSDDIKNMEEYLRKNDPENGYFNKINKFEEEFTNALKA
jgi:hypothetical protein